MASKEQAPIIKRYLAGDTSEDEERQLSIDLEPSFWRNLQIERAARDHARWVVVTEAKVPEVAAMLRDREAPDATAIRVGLALLLELQMQANREARKK